MPGGIFCSYQVDKLCQVHTLYQVPGTYLHVSAMASLSVFNPPPRSSATAVTPASRTFHAYEYTNPFRQTNSARRHTNGRKSAVASEKHLTRYRYVSCQLNKCYTSHTIPPGISQLCFHRPWSHADLMDPTRTWALRIDPDLSIGRPSTFQH